MGWVKYSRKGGGDVKNGLKCEMDDGSVPSMASKPPTNHLFSPQAKPVTDYGNKQKSNKFGYWQIQTWYKVQVRKRQTNRKTDTWKCHFIVFASN